MDPKAQERRPAVETRNQRRNSEQRWIRTKKAFNVKLADLDKAISRLTRKQAQQLQFDAHIRPTAQKQQSRGVRYIGGKAMTKLAIMKLAGIGPGPFAEMVKALGSFQ